MKLEHKLMQEIGITENGTKVVVLSEDHFDELIQSEWEDYERHAILNEEAPIRQKIPSINPFQVITRVYEDKNGVNYISVTKESHILTNSLSHTNIGNYNMAVELDKQANERWEKLKDEDIYNKTLLKEDKEAAAEVAHLKELMENSDFPPETHTHLILPMEDGTWDLVVVPRDEITFVEADTSIEAVLNFNRDL